MKAILFIVGPTAVGKTKVAIELARIIRTEIISCDSMQVYKGINVISQKPTGGEQKQVPHHMIDIVYASRNFSVADFRKRATALIAKMEKRGKTPLLAGGTALYMKILLDGLFPSPEPDLKLRGKLKRAADKNGNGYLYRRLKEIDPPTAEILHPNDTRRIIRALEVYEQSGLPMSELKKKTRGLGKEYSPRIFCLNRPREELYERINKRVDKMFASGAVAECKKLKDRKLSKSASQVLGLKEVFAYIAGECTKEEAKELLKQNTRRFAKRQLSWFRNDPRIEWVNINSGNTPKQTARLLQERLK